MKDACCELDEQGIWRLSQKEQREIREEEVSYEQILEKWMLAFDSQLARGKSPEEALFWLSNNLPERERFHSIVSNATSCKPDQSLEVKIDQHGVKVLGARCLRNSTHGPSAVMKMS